MTNTHADEKAPKPVTMSDPSDDGYTMNSDDNGYPTASGTLFPGNPRCEVTVTFYNPPNAPINGHVSYPTPTTWIASFRGAADTTAGRVEVTNSCGGSAEHKGLIWMSRIQEAEAAPQLLITYPALTVAHPHPQVGRMFHVRGLVTPRDGYRLSPSVLTAQEIPIYGLVIPPIDLHTDHWTGTVVAYEHGEGYSVRAHLTDGDGFVLVQRSRGPFRIN